MTVVRLRAARFSSLTLEAELENNTNSVIPYFSLNIGIMVAFCIFTCMMTDWVKSKPMLGLLGVISAILATIAAFGFVIYLGTMGFHLSTGMDGSACSVVSVLVKYYKDITMVTLGHCVKCTNL